MKKIIQLLILIISLQTFAQKPKADVYRYSKFTTTERNALTPENNNIWFLYNSTTARFEFYNGTDWIGILDNIVKKQNLTGGNSITGTQTFTNSGIGISLDIRNNLTGDGIYIGNADSGDGLKIENASIGKGIYINSGPSSTGAAININNRGTGFSYIGENNGTNTFTVDKLGNIVGKSFTGDGSNLTSIAEDASKQNLTGGNIITGTQFHRNNGTAQSIEINNDSTGNGIYVNNNSTGYGINSNNQSTNTGILSQNQSSGQGIYSSNKGIGQGIYLRNESTGDNLFSANESTGNGIVSQGLADATGFNYIGRNVAENTFTVDKLGSIISATDVQALTITPTAITTGNIPYKSANELLDSPISIDGNSVAINAPHAEYRLDVNGTFRAKGSSVFEGSLRALKINPTAITTGNIPYKSNAELIDSPISTDGTDVTVIGNLSTRGSSSDTSSNAFISRNLLGTSLFSIRNDGRIDAKGPFVLNGSMTVADNLQALTITPTAITTGNVPYKSANELLDSPIYTDGTDVRVGGKLGIATGTDDIDRQFEVKSDGGIVGVFTSTVAGSYIGFEDDTTTSDSKVRFGAIGDNAIIRSGGSQVLNVKSSLLVEINNDLGVLGNATIGGDVSVTAENLTIGEGGTISRLKLGGNDYKIEGGSNFGDLRQTAPRHRFFEGSNLIVQIDDNKLKAFGNFEAVGDAYFGGSMSVGTDTPLSQVTIQKSNSTVYDDTDLSGQDSEGTTAMLFNTNATENTFSQILFRNRNSSVGISRIVGLTTGENSTALSFVTENSNSASEKLRIKSNGEIQLEVTPEFANNAAAIAGGLSVKTIYRTGDILKIVH
jgi:hypothetical protein